MTEMEVHALLKRTQLGIRQLMYMILCGKKVAATQKKEDKNEKKKLCLCTII